MILARETLSGFSPTKLQENALCCLKPLNLWSFVTAATGNTGAMPHSAFC